MGLSVLLTFFYKAINWGVRIALSRITIVTAFVAAIIFAIRSIYEDYDSLAGAIRTFFTFLQTDELSALLRRWSVNNQFIDVIGYALALDVFLNWLFDFIFGFFISFVVALVASVFSVFLYSAPIMVDLITSGIRTQIVKLKF